MRRRNPDVPTPVIVAVSLAAGGALAWWWMSRATPTVTPMPQTFAAPIGGIPSGPATTAAVQQAAQQALLAQQTGMTGAQSREWLAQQAAANPHAPWIVGGGLRFDNLAPPGAPVTPEVIR